MTGSRADENPPRRSKLALLDSLHIRPGPGSLTSSQSMIAVLRTIDAMCGHKPRFVVRAQVIAARAGLSVPAARRAIYELERQSLLIVRRRTRERRTGGDGPSEFQLVWSNLRAMSAEQGVQHRLPLSAGEHAPDHRDKAPDHGDKAPDHGDKAHRGVAPPTAIPTALPTATSTSGGVWAEAEEALRSYGVRCARAACQKARRNGCTPEHVLGLVAHARLHDQGGVRRWDSGGLWSRVANADPQLSVADGWLSDRDAWTRATRDQALACQRRRDARASPTWEQAEAAVERQGVGDWRGACDAARSLGLSPGEVIAAAEYFAAHRQWFRGAGALFWKLTKTKPGRPVADDWPIPSEEAIAAQRREEQLARQDWMERLRLLSAAELRDLVSWAEAELGDVLLASQCDPLGEGECLVCAQSLDGLIRAFRARESGRFV